MSQNQSEIQKNETASKEITKEKPIDFTKYFGEVQRPHFRDSDLIIPQIQIINDKNRFIQDNESKVDGAEIGMMINTVSEELFPAMPGIGIIPCVWRTGYEEFSNERKSKYIATHMDDPETLANPIRKSAEWIDKQLTTKDGTLLKLLHKYYVLYWDLTNDPKAESAQQAVIKFKSYSIQSGAKSMNSKIQIMMARKVPMFGLQFQLSLYEKHIENGDYWYFKTKFQSIVQNEKLFHFAMDTAKTIGEGAFVEDEQEPEVDAESKQVDDSINELFG
jgi:hypothetical protein